MNNEIIISELIFKAIRSSGPGGQHVNKTSSKIVASFHIQKSEGLSEEEKELLLNRLSNRISSEGFLSLSSSNSRSQHRNKIIVIDKLIELLKANLKIKALRKKSKPSKSAIEKRLQHKKKNATKKLNRKRPLID